jgi:hypothetical protein
MSIKRHTDKVETFLFQTHTTDPPVVFCKNFFAQDTKGRITRELLIYPALIQTASWSAQPSRLGRFVALNGNCQAVHEDLPELLDSLMKDHASPKHQ